MVSDESNLDFRSRENILMNAAEEMGQAVHEAKSAAQKFRTYIDPKYPKGTERISMFLGRSIPHDQCAEILLGPLQDAIQLFVKRQAEYGESANHLGAKGQFADINRKFWKLKRLMWDESVPKDAISESAEEVLMDFIGHCLLSIHYLRQEKDA